MVELILSVETADRLIHIRQIAACLFGGGCDGSGPLGTIALHNGSAGGGPVTGTSIETAHPVLCVSSRWAVEFAVVVIFQRTSNISVSTIHVPAGHFGGFSAITAHVAGEVQDRFGSLVVTHQVVAVTAVRQ